MLSEEPDACVNTVFIDVDYDKLMKQKCHTIRSTTQMSDLVTENSSFHSQSQVLMRSDHYIAVACDLSDSKSLESTLRELIPNNYHILYVAEVSMTYMDVDAADRVIKMAAQFPRSRFCLLEQWMPAGPLHPFASTMIKHFEKLQSPLKAPIKYQNSASQKRRFQSNGWQEIQVRSLWDCWSDDIFLSSSDRKALNQIEQFDEWEEFVLFSQHYFLLIASSPSPYLPSRPLQIMSPAGEVAHLKSTFAPYVATEQLHRNSASLRTSTAILCHGGQGTRGRVKNSFAYSIDKSGELSERVTASLGPSLLPNKELMFHTITRLDQDTFILVGGRTAPNLSSNHCFLRDKHDWKQVADLPEGRYRHCAVSVRIELPEYTTSAVLVFGGKISTGEIISSWLIWWPQVNKWHQLQVYGEAPSPRFATAMSVGRADSPSQGHLCGGIGMDEKILADLWRWEIKHTASGIQVKCTNYTKHLESRNESAKSFGRIGASLFESKSLLYLIGGACDSAAASSHEAILKLDQDLEMHAFALEADSPPPLLIGHCIELINDSNNNLSIAIAGGGAICFSFGTFWNQGAYLLSTRHTTLVVRPWTVLSGQLLLSTISRSYNDVQQYKRDDLASAGHGHEPNSSYNGLGMTSTGSPKGKVCILAAQILTAQDFERTIDRAVPCIFQSLNLGRCVAVWDLDYLQQKLGDAREIIVHASPRSQMDFLGKNFEYQKMRFADFTNAVKAKERLYLRSLSSANPTQQPTKLEVDFAEISADFELPDELKFATDNMHSSPLRISGPVNMWLHFDVMANILCQISGAKRVVLFHPSKVDQLEFPHGFSSSQMVVFNRDGEVRRELYSLEPWVCDLQAGEVLFIPALWPHATFPIDDISIAVNVFFRSLDKGYAAGKDVYGNRDVQAYENGRRDIERVRKSFTRLPEDFQTFYLARLAAELVSASDNS